MQRETQEGQIRKQDWLSADSERKEGWQKVVIERAWDANDTSLNISF